uniref:Olfactory receptor n=1 Tax=Geotrypetes seraphini TaxID=260995 RepID=A0A6P8NWZ4_GEOSA
MSPGNQTSVTGFILLGFSGLSLPLQCFLFVTFLVIYVLTLFGNIIILMVITAEPVLHTPMYFFLRNLSFLEICYTSVTIPKMLVIFWSNNRSISFLGCAVQMYFFFAFGVTECFLLAMMAYDRYVAISNPLRYVSIMTRKVCLFLSLISVFGGFLESLGQTSFIFSLPYCASNKIYHFFCDIPSLLRLACTDTFLNEIVFAICTVLFALFPFLMIVVSYSHILSAILKINSLEGRHKAFSTCASHLTSVALFYGSGVFTYLRPKSSHSPERDQFFALFYSIITPLLNPLIYSLRNNEVKDAPVQVIGEA